MKQDLVDILACPLDKQPLALEVHEEKDGDVITGSLTCSLCSQVYPVENSIPNLLPPQTRV